MATKKLDAFATAEAEKQKLVANLSVEPSILAAADILFAKSMAWGNKFNIGQIVPNSSPDAVKIGKILDEIYPNDNSYATYTARIVGALLDEEIPTARTTTNKVKYETGTVVKLIKNFGGSSRFNYDVGVPLFVVSGPSAFAVPTEKGMPQNHLDMNASNIQIPTVAEISNGLAEFYIRDSVFFTAFIEEHAK